MKSKIKNGGFKPATKINLIDMAADFYKAEGSHNLSASTSTPDNNRERALLLQELIATDPIISKFPTHQTVDAFQQLLRIAPELSDEKEITRAFLRQAVTPQAIDPFQAEQLIKANIHLFKQHQLQKVVERFIPKTKSDGILESFKNGNNVFEMTSGGQFPHNMSQTTWHYAKGNDYIHLRDGFHTYSFKGQLDDAATELEKIPDVPLPDMYTNATSKGKAQVHKSDPSNICFTLQVGRINPTYTLKKVGGCKWRALKKARPFKSTPRPEKKRK